MDKKKLVIVGGILVVGGVAAYMLYQKSKGAAALPNSSSGGSAENAAPGNLYPLGTADIQAAYNRLPAAQQPAFLARVQSFNAAQLQEMDDVAYAWNNNIPLNADQMKFWGTYGTF